MFDAPPAGWPTASGHRRSDSGASAPAAHETALRPGASASVWDEPAAEPTGPAGASGVVRAAGVPGGPPDDPAYDSDDRNWVRYRPRWGGLMRILLFALLIAASVMWLRNRIYQWIDEQVDPAGPAGGEVEYTVVSGASVNDVAGDLHAVGVISNATVFRYWLRCDGQLAISEFLGCDSSISVEAGDYEFKENMDFKEVLGILTAGPAPADPVALARITIPEGLRWAEMADLLVERNPSFTRSELESAFTSLVDEAEYLPDDDGQQRTLEGLLFPATYDIYRGGLADERAFLLRLSDEFDRRFGSLMGEVGLPPEYNELELRPYDIVVIASLVEEEALIDADRPKIARVIYNRYAVGEFLGIDASACFAAAKPCSELTQEDLMRESPWNTRATRGLPPTPISAPGEDSLRAALQPAEGDWLFYVLTDAGGVKGAHHFSETLDEHNEYVRICRELGYCR